MEAYVVVQRGFFDLDGRYAALSAAGDQLEKLGALIDFEIFRPALDAALQRSDGSKGGRPPMDAVMMFKTLVLQTLYGLSDAQTEFHILDRRSFGRFLGLDEGDNTPDETTIWRFREALVRAKAIDALFTRFDAHLKSLGYLAMGGQIVDASIIAAPRQRMTDEERAIVKDGGIPEDWAAKPARLAQTVTRAGRSSAAAARKARTENSWQRSPRPSSATNRISVSTRDMGSSAPGRPAMPPATMAGSFRA